MIAGGAIANFHHPNKLTVIVTVFNVTHGHGHGHGKFIQMFKE
jgi:hypothetical protein